MLHQTADETGRADTDELAEGTLPSTHVSVSERIQRRRQQQDGKPVKFESRLPFAEFTDDAIARHVAGKLEGVVLSIPATSGWKVWTGDRWRDDDMAAAKAQVREQLARMVAAYHSEGVKWATRANQARVQGESDVRPNDYPPFKVARRYLSRAKHEAITALVREDPRLTRSAAEFDSDPWHLATPGATVDLRTGESKTPDPQDLITRFAPTRFDPDAKAPRFSQFLDEITGGDRAQAAYLQTLLGYAITGSYREQEMYVFYGDGSNGKDTLMEVVESVIGDYAGRGTENMLVERKHDKHPAEVFALRGRRLVIHSESDQGRRLNHGRVKEFTGSPNITAYAMRQNPVTFPNTWTHILMTNHLPVVSGTDYGIQRRLVVVPFPTRFYRPDEPRPEGGLLRDEHLATRIIEEESEGVLAWLVAGAVQYHTDGLVRPTAVVKATEAYIGKVADPHGVWQWIQQNCEDAPGEATPFATLHADHTAWATSHNKREASDVTFAKKLESLGYAGGKKRIGGVETRVRHGLRLKAATIGVGVARTALEASRPQSIY